MLKPRQYSSLASTTNAKQFVNPRISLALPVLKFFILAPSRSTSRRVKLLGFVTYYPGGKSGNHNGLKQKKWLCKGGSHFMPVKFSPNSRLVLSTTTQQWRMALREPLTDHYCFNSHANQHMELLILSQNKIGTNSLPF